MMLFGRMKYGWRDKSTALHSFLGNIIEKSRPFLANSI